MSSPKQDNPHNPTLDDIATGLISVKHKDERDAKDVLEEKEFEVDELKIKHRKDNEIIKDIRSDRKLRQKYADKIMLFLQYYSISILFLLLFSGFPIYEFTLPESVLVSLVGSTAVAAIGLVGFIAKGLFGNKNNL